MKIIENFLTKNSCYTTNEKITVKGLMLHSVGCSQPSAPVFMKSWNKSNVQKCVHAFIDGNTGDIHQTLPWNHRGWHGGGSSNDTHIGVEMCEPACIKYTSGSKFTCSDFDTARAVAKRTYESAVELFAFLCKEFNLDPLADGVILSHTEGHTRGIASNHGDPEHLWKGLGMPYTMNTFRQAVKDAMKLETPSDGVIYCVQVGAYKVKSEAERMLEKVKSAGFDAFITTKNVKIPEPVKKEIKVGSVVKVNRGAKTYTGGNLASFVYEREHVVKQVNVDRVVITYNGTIIAAVKKSDLTIID